MHRIASLRRSGDAFALTLSDGRSVDGGAVILATGASYRRLGYRLAGSVERCRRLLRWSGLGSAWARRPKDVYVVGGGNSAGQAALHLARYARRVTLVVRAPSLEAGMSHYLIQAVAAAPNVDVRTGTTIVGWWRRESPRAASPTRQCRRRRNDGHSRRPVRPDRRPSANRVATRGHRARRVRIPPDRRGRHGHRLVA